MAPNRPDWNTGQTRLAQVGSDVATEAPDGILRKGRRPWGVSTPFWPTGFPRKDSRPKPGALFITRQSEQTAPQNGPTDTQGPSRSGNKLQMTIRNSTRLPEGRFSSHGRLPASLRGASTKNRDHDGPRAPHNEP
ncbi:hypothetical protein CRG98_026229 [Punica granatum]|uniref:Uncharacterized protein n=1 Tax=Punica granatum TaxID=22663 RepID=A0A2I0JAV7_PUNGR|nr:hypothetical protein CRG98_026229 [Punica granatum]